MTTLMRFIKPTKKSIAVIVFLFLMIFWGSCLFLKLKVVKTVLILNEESREISLFYLSDLIENVDLGDNLTNYLNEIVFKVNENNGFKIKGTWKCFDINFSNNYNENYLFYCSDVVKGSVIVITREGLSHWIKLDSGCVISPPGF